MSRLVGLVVRGKQTLHVMLIIVLMVGFDYNVYTYSCHGQASEATLGS